MRMETDNFGKDESLQCYAYIDQSGLNGDKVIVVSDVAELTKQQAADFARQMLEMVGES